MQIDTLQTELLCLGFVTEAQDSVLVLHSLPFFALFVCRRQTIRKKSRKEVFDEKLQLQGRRLRRRRPTTR